MPRAHRSPPLLPTLLALLAAVGSAAFSAVDGQTGFQAQSPPPLAARRWRAVGPEGGRVNSLATDPGDADTVYAGLMGGGVFASRDGGGSWHELGSNLPALDIQGLTVDPVEPGAVYAASFGGAVFLYRGKGWAALGGDLSAYHLKTLLAHGGRVWLGTSQGVVLRLSPGDTAWTVSARGPGRPVFALAIHPRHPEELLAGTADGIFRSGDGGETWARSDLGLGDPFVKSLAFNPEVPERVLAGTASGLWVSSDGGWSWRASGRGLPASELRALAFAGSRRLLGAGIQGVYESRDRGRSWAPLGPSLPQEVSTLLLTPRGRLLVGCAGAGVFVADETGGAWTPSRTGLTAAVALSLTRAPEAPGRLWVGTSGRGVVELLAQQAPEAPEPPEAPEAPEEGAPGPQPVGAILAVAGAASGAPAGEITLLAAQRGPGLVRSLNGGSTWEALPTFPPALASALAHAPGRNDSPGTVWAALAGGGLVRSGDLGGTWERAGQGLDGAAIRDLAVDPGDPQSLWAVGDGGIFHTFDGGDRWLAVSTLPGLVGSLGARALAVVHPFPDRPARVLVGTITHGVIESLDGGLSWERLSSGLGSLDVRALAVDPTPPTTLYAATAAGVYERRGEEPWHPAAPGLSNRDVVDLLLDPGPPKSLWAATLGRGVFVLPLAPEAR